MSAVSMVKYAPILEEISKNILFPGIKVRLANKEELIRRFGARYYDLPPYINTFMKEFLGAIVTVDKIRNHPEFNSSFCIPKEYEINRSNFKIIEDGRKWLWSIWMLDFSNIEIGKRGNIFSYLQRFKRIKEQLERIRGQYDR